MTEYRQIDINQYIGKQIRCSCGRIHETTVKCIDIARGATQRLAAHVQELGYAKIFLVADQNTWQAAGKAAAEELEKAQVACEKLVFQREDDLVPDEIAVGELEVAFPADTDLVLAVGAGTINDLCKFISWKNHVDYMIFASAPSMDGFTSTGAALVLHHVKTTLETHGPVAVIGDAEILAKAPLEMITAGLGDTLGKYTCLLDWKLAHRINGEYYCREIARMVEEALQRVQALSARLGQQDPEAAEALTKALVLTGLAMSFAGNSRPASGCEHHLSHFWEMRYQMEGRKPILHGIKVAIGLVTSLKLYQMLAEEEPDFEALKQSAGALQQDGTVRAGEDSLHDPAFWEREIRREYKEAADGILQLEQKTRKNDEAARQKRLAVMEAAWPEIRQLIRESLPAPEEAEKILLTAGAPVNPEQIGLHAGLVEEAVRVAKEVRDRYTVLQILWDLDLSERFAKAAREYFEKGQPVYRDHQKQQLRKQLEKVRCFVLDMDGTIYLGNELFPFTRAFLEKVEETGRQFVFFTNNSSKNKQDYLEKLERMQIPTVPEKMYTSSEVIAEYLRAEHPDDTCYVVGTPSLEKVLRESGCHLVQEDPDIVILGFDTTLVYEKLDKASRFLEQGAVYYGVHPDKVCPVEGKHMMPDCGAMAALMEATTGQLPRYFGKPARETLDYVIRHTGCREDEIAFVGDRMYTDIAVADGTRALSILVLTGETKREELAEYPYAPDMTVESLETLTELL